MMKDTKSDVLVVLEKDGSLAGVLPATDLMVRLSKGKVTSTDAITKIYLRRYRQVSDDMPLSELARVLTRAKYAIINSVSGKPVAVTSRDVLDFMQTGEPAGPQLNADIKTQAEEF